MKISLVISFILLGICCYGINPKKDYISTPKELGINYEEVIIKKRNVEICVWISNPQAEISNNKTIILAYGDYGNMSYYLPYVDFYTKLGFKVISFDYRGFGKSSPFLIDSNILFYEEFATDMEEVINYCKENLNIKKIGIVSLSMGTILTVIAVQKEKVEFIIAEGCVYDINEVIRRLNIIKNKKVTVFKPYNLPRLWRSVKSKILIFVANKDSITTIKDSKNIISQNKLKRSMSIYQGNHLSVLNDPINYDYYKQKINIFLNGK